MAPRSEEREAYLYVTVPWPVHRALAELASQYGVNLSEFVRELVMEALTQHRVPSWYETFREAHTRTRIEHLFVQEARSHLLRADEEALTATLEAAAKAGADPDRVLALASELAQTSLALSGTVQAAVDLLLNLTLADNAVPATLAVEAAAREGISSWALYQAKRALGLASRRGGRGWIWIRPEGDKHP